jgi:hypothetical protein
LIVGSQAPWTAGTYVDRMNDRFISGLSSA